MYDLGGLCSKGLALFRTWSKVTAHNFTYKMENASQVCAQLDETAQQNMNMNSKWKRTTRSLPNDETLCEVISRSIVNIIKVTNHQDFKHQCYVSIDTEDNKNLSIEAKLVNQFRKFLSKTRKRKYDHFFEDFNQNPGKDNTVFDFLCSKMDGCHLCAEELVGFDEW